MQRIRPRRGKNARGVLECDGERHEQQRTVTGNVLTAHLKDGFMCRGSLGKSFFWCHTPYIMRRKPGNCL